MLISEGLQDLLGNTRLPLDTHFKFSLSIDIAQGMAFLHNSSIHFHGRLNSATCLIDNRFSVKLTDVGVPCIFDNIVVDKQSQEYKLECLWKSPEELRDHTKTGSQHGDVYSFGIILQEIITREAPFFEETDTIGVDGVLHKVKRGGVPAFRPKVAVPDNLRDLSILMETCWDEDPGRRPQFHSIRKALKTLAARFGASGSLMDSLLRRMEQYANNLEKLVDEKTVELQEEKKKSEELLYQILPRSVANSLRQGFKVDPEDFENVTIYFSDICGFTTISAMSTPFQVVDLLNDLYTCFDAVIDRFDVYKVETIGDAYMVVSGLPQKNGNRHASEIARMSLALLKEIDTFKIRHLPNERLLLRIGLHSGPVVAGVVGLKMPRYCLFGDTVNTASRMESHGEELKIHMSGSTAQLLQRFEIFNLKSRGCVEIKGKGLMETYWLLGVTKV
ncbi:atrial natriuretic peptide receptor 1-like [Haliotis rubra]|uniref:atrial natriuretic peptide receptor 1-like n=1 Tax=Haliotis rubra TaxID=36100 RepID=UPI001EE51F9C|nr:atrial natriuretic peptide receptor 1-like [Haliotis rubra]